MRRETNGGVLVDDRKGDGLRTRQIVAVLALAFFSTVSVGEEGTGTKVRFNLPAVEFPKSILEFSRQSKVEVLFLASDSLRNVITHSVKGELSPQEALTQMLRGTGLVFEFDTNHSVTVRQPQSALQSMIELDIPAGPADQTFSEWRRQAGKQLLFDHNVVRRYRTEAIKGKFEPIDSLLRMTRGTDLVASQVNDRTYSLTRTAARKSLSERLTDVLHRVRSSRNADVAEVLVAASRVKGLLPVTRAPILTFDRAEIDAAGVTSVAEFLSTIPQVWGGGPNEYSQIGREGLTNSTRGFGLNFHALGAESTLVLIDGVRPAKSGTEAGWWDDSLLPLSAIERIEIVPEGGSVRYGSDAISAVVNFVTRSDFGGAETQAQFSDTTNGAVGARRLSQLLGHRWEDGDASIVLEYDNRDSMASASRAQATSDLRPWGGTNWNSPYGYPGTLVATTGQTWAITGVSDGKPVLGPMGSSNNYDTWQAGDVLPWQQRLSLMGHASMLLSDVRIWSSLWLSDRHTTASYGHVNGETISIPSTNPGYVNPLGTDGPVYVEYGFWNLIGPVRETGSALSASAAAGVVIEKLGWTFDLSGQTGLERDRVLGGGAVNFTVFEQALSAPDPLNPFAPASSVEPAVLAGLSLDEYYQSYSRIQAVDVSADRTVHAGLAGDAEFSIGTQYRQESLSSFNALQGWQDAGRRVRSIYSNLDLPIIGEGQLVPLVTRLGVSVGGRYEKYSDGDAATSPFFLLEWAPVATLSLRGTYRRGFRPPALTERETLTNVSGIITLSDGRTALVESGGNPDLRPEIARTWTGGVDYKPFERVQLSATYYTVASFGRVLKPTFSFNLSDFTGRVVENPTASDRAAVCRESRFMTGPQALCEQASVGLFMDDRLLSTESLTTAGTDVLAQYTADEWKFRFDGTYLLSYKGVGNGVILEQLNTLNSPVDLRLRTTAARKIGPVTITGSISYTGSYWDTLSQPRRRIGSWTTVDVAARYKPADTALLHRAEIILGARNLLDRSPPFANNAAAQEGWDPANGGDLEGRVVSGQIRWIW